MEPFFLEYIFNDEQVSLRTFFRFFLIFNSVTLFKTGHLYIYIHSSMCLEQPTHTNIIRCAVFLPAHVSI